MCVYVFMCICVHVCVLCAWITCHVYYLAHLLMQVIGQGSLGRFEWVCRVLWVHYIGPFPVAANVFRQDTSQQDVLSFWEAATRGHLNIVTFLNHSKVFLISPCQMPLSQKTDAPVPVDKRYQQRLLIIYFSIFR